MTRSFYQSYFMQYTRLCVLSLHFLMTVRIVYPYFIVLSSLKASIWIISHCLRLRHETMVLHYVLLCSYGYMVVWVWLYHSSYWIHGVHLPILFRVASYANTLLWFPKLFLYVESQFTNCEYMATNTLALIDLAALKPHWTVINIIFTHTNDTTQHVNSGQCNKSTHNVYIHNNSNRAVVKSSNI